MNTKRNNWDAWQIVSAIAIGVTIGALCPAWWIL